MFFKTLISSSFCSLDVSSATLSLSFNKSISFSDFCFSSLSFSIFSESSFISFSFSSTASCFSLSFFKFPSSSWIFAFNFSSSSLFCFVDSSKAFLCSSICFVDSSFSSWSSFIFFSDSSFSFSRVSTFFFNSAFSFCAFLIISLRASSFACDSCAFFIGFSFKRTSVTDFSKSFHLTFDSLFPSAITVSIFSSLRISVAMSDKNFASLLLDLN